MQDTIQKYKPYISIQTIDDYKNQQIVFKNNPYLIHPPKWVTYLFLSINSLNLSKM